MRFQYLSDLHLEFYNECFSKIERLFVHKIKNQRSRPDVLLLAGDIGYPFRNSYRRFLEEMSLLYERVVITTGN